MFTVLALMLVGSAGCKPDAVEKPQPKVAPPAIKAAGTLRVGVDLATPPYAGVDLGKKAGIDVDVAAAVAEQLGLEVAYVDVKPSDAATALAQGKADVVLSVPFVGSGSSQVTLAGTYITSAPAFFVTTEGTASVEPSITIDTVAVPKVGAQAESQAFWMLTDQLGPDAVQSYGSLRDAIEALDAGTAELVAGDALVGAYIIRDFPQVSFAGQVGPGVPLAAAVALENTTLADGVRGALDQLAADGVLQFVRTKWVGELPELTVQESADSTATP
jgi:polar amino acid transport system substrate-binding protein